MVNGRELLWVDPVLVVISGRELGRSVEIPVGELSIGRSPDCDFTIESGSISRRHAKLVRLPDGRIFIEDQGSSCGQYVNGHKVQREQLHPGDCLQFGDSTIAVLKERAASQE